MDAHFISGQLRLLQDHLSGARRSLKGDGEDAKIPWCEESADENVSFDTCKEHTSLFWSLIQQQSFDPPPPHYLSFHLSIFDAALVLQLRTLEPVLSSHTPTTSFAPEIGLSGFSLRDRLFGPKLPVHDETGDVFHWHGEDVKVMEKVRVESQDPNLMAALAKLTALDHEITKWRTALAAVMGEESSIE